MNIQKSKSRDRSRYYLIGVIISIIFFTLSCAVNREARIKSPNSQTDQSPNEELDANSDVASCSSKTQDVGGLRFQANEFKMEGKDRVVASGTVCVGFTPSNESQFLPLIQINDDVTISTDSDPEFSSSGAVNSMIGGSSIVIFEGEFSININELLNDGDSIGIGSSFDVKGVDFQMNTLLFTDTLSGQLKMHGDIRVAELDNLQIKVEGNDFVVIDQNGVDLTGLEVDLNPTDTFKLSSVKFIPDSLVFEYQQDSSFYEISGGGKIIVDQDTISIEMGTTSGTPGIIIQSGKIQDFDITVSQDSIFNLKGIQFDPELLNLTYKADNSLYSMYGNAKAIVQTDTIVINAGTQSLPGLVIENGSIDTVNFNIVQGDTFAIGGDLEFIPDSLSFMYTKALNSDDNIYRIGGKFSIMAGGDTIAVNMKEMEIVNGHLDSFDISFTSSFTLGELEIQTNDLELSYHESDGTHTNTDYELTGSISISELFDATADFPGKGIVVENGQWELDSFDISLSKVQLDVFEIDSLNVLYGKTEDSYDLDVTLDLSFPGGFTVDGSIDLVNGKVNEVSVSATSVSEAIPIGDTGVSIYTIGAEVNNISNPRNIYVQGDIGVGLGDGEVDTSFFKVFAEFGVDRESLKLQGDCTFGFEAEGTIEIDLNWLDGIYTAQTDWTLYEIFELMLSFTLCKTLVTMYGEAELIIPEEIPIIGGDELAGAGFYFQKHIPTTSESDFVAGWGKILFWEAGVKVPLLNPDDYSIIGSAQINDIEHLPRSGTTVFTYTAITTAPQGASHLILHASWPKVLADQEVAVILPDSDTIPSTDFLDDNGIYIDSTHSSDTSITILIRNPKDTTRFGTVDSGAYHLQVKTTTPISSDTLAIHSRYAVPKPLLTIDSISVPYDSSFAIIYHTTKATSFGDDLEVGFFIDTDSLDFDGGPMAEISILSGTFETDGISSDTFHYDLTNLTPINYYAYGVIKDQINVPDTSAYSDSFTSNPAIIVTVESSANTNNTGIPNVTVTAVQEGGQDTIYSTTNSKGTCSFSDLIEDSTYIITVVPPVGYVAFNQDSLVIKRTITDQTTQPFFTLVELATISGVAFFDMNANGEYEESTDSLLSGQQIILTASNGIQDSTITNLYGSYEFYELEPDSYSVEIVIRDPWYQLTPDTAIYHVSIQDSIDQVVDLNFGLIEKIEISGYVFYDYNANNIVEPGDSVMAGVAISLTLENDSTQIDTTDAFGFFLFSRKDLSNKYKMELVALDTGYIMTSKKTAPSFSLKEEELNFVSQFYSPFFEFADYNNDHQIDHVIARLILNENSNVNVYSYNLSQFVTNNIEGGLIINAHIPPDNFALAKAVDLNNEGYNQMLTIYNENPGPDSTYLSFGIPEGNGLTNISAKIFSSVFTPVAETIILDSLRPPSIIYTSESLGVTTPILIINESDSVNYSFVEGSMPSIFTNSGLSVEQMIIGNLYDTGMDDLFFDLTSDSILLLQNLGNGNFGDPEFILQDSIPCSLEDCNYTLGDINNDGKDDILYYANHIAYKLNESANGKLQFSDWIYLPNGEVSSSYVYSDIKVSDMDHNGLNDLIVQIDSTEFTIFLNQGMLLFETYSIRSSNNIHQFQIGDINSNGLDDIVYSVLNFGESGGSNIQYMAFFNSTTFADQYDFAAQTGDVILDYNFGLQQKNAQIPDAPDFSLLVPDTTFAQSIPWPPNPYYSPPNPPRRWVSGNMVRYAVSYYNEEAESLIGPWTDWIDIEFALPLLTDIPIGPEGTIGRKIYRQFWIRDAKEHADVLQVIGALEDNTTTTYQDESN